MKKNLLSFALVLAGFTLLAQNQRMTLYEEFTGENCPPCAATNPALNAKLKSATNATRCIAIKWEVPIPSAPSAAWSLYQTNKAEIDWRYRSTTSGGYGYVSQSSASSGTTNGINSAPQGRFDGRHQWEFGASSDHPTYVNDQVILNAYNVTTPFIVNMNREWNTNGTAVNVTVNIQSTGNFTSVGNLVFRLVMVERNIQFTTAPGSNGEKDFDDVAIKSFPNIQNGTPMASTWINGQSQTFTISCTIPTYVRKKSEIAMVGFIQDDGDRKIWQAARADKQAIPYDVVAVNAKADVTCDNSIEPVITMRNDGAQTITTMTITPYIDGTAGTPQVWTGNLATGASVTHTMSAITTPTLTGSHTFSYNITGLNSPDFLPANNGAKVNFLVASDYDATPVSEGFTVATYPPAGWVTVNADGGPSWSRSTLAGSYQQIPLHSAKYDFYSNKNIGDIDELILPPVDLLGSATPQIGFDYAHAQQNLNNMDKLEVLASSDCGQNWTTIFSRTGTQLATTSEVNGVPYTPGASEFAHWITVAEPLTGFNTGQVLVKFRVTNDNGNNLYIDNINLSQSAPTGLQQLGAIAFRANIYPNPSSGLSTMQVTSPSNGVIVVTMMNTLGQVLSSRQVKVVAGDNYMPVDLTEYPAGVYSLVLDTNNGSITKKITINR